MNERLSKLFIHTCLLDIRRQALASLHNVWIMLIRNILTLLLVANSSQLETTVIKLNNQYLPGIFPDYNLCQIYPPVSFKQDGKLFTGAKPNFDNHDNLRYIVLHKCRRSSKQDSLYDTYLNKAFECEDTRFVQVKKQKKRSHFQLFLSNDMWLKGGLFNKLLTFCGYLLRFYKHVTKRWLLSGPREVLRTISLQGLV